MISIALYNNPAIYPSILIRFAHFWRIARSVYFKFVHYEDFKNPSLAHMAKKIDQIGQSDQFLKTGIHLTFNGQSCIVYLIDDRGIHMLKEQRHSAICNELKKSGYASIHSLSQALNISKSTIRRDILDLEAAGKLKRTRGGAVSSEQVAVEPSFDARLDTARDEKQRIAQAALSLVKPNETLILSGGTTVLEFAKTLNTISPLYVATTDLMSAATLSKFQNVELTIIGGTVRHRHYNVVGYFTETMIRQIHADKSFIGVDAVDFDIGLMNFSSEDITVNRMIMEASKQVIVLCDHTKFSSIAFANICAFSEIDILITGKETSPNHISRLEELGIEVITV